MKRGIVMSVHANHAVVLTADGRFARAPIQGSPQIGEEIVFEDEVASPRRRLKGTVIRYVSVAALAGILFVASLIVAWKQMNPVVAYLTLDINPSLEIGVDGTEKVRKLRALNAEGEKIIQGLSYKGLHVQTVAAAILEQASESHYLDRKHNEIIITSMMMSNRRGLGAEFEALLTQKLDLKLQQWLEGHADFGKDVTITTWSVPWELREAAVANGISSGKMAVYLMVKSEGYNVELEELKRKSIEKLTKSMGGVQGIVAESEEGATRERLQELLLAEQKEKQEAAGHATPSPKPTATASEKPTVKPTAKPTPKPTPKSTASPTSKPAGGKPSDKGNGKGNGKGNENRNDNQNGNTNMKREDIDWPDKWDAQLLMQWIDRHNDKNKNNKGDNRNHSNDKERNQGKGNDQGKGKGNSQGKGNDQGKDQGKDKDRHKDNHNEKDRNKDKDRGKQGDKDSGKGKSGSSGRDKGGNDKRWS